MKTKSLKKDKVNIVTLGCSKNLVDSEVLLTQLKGNSIEATHEAQKSDANVVVINTCGFIDNAKQESIDTILSYVDAKQRGDVEKVYVTGCLSHRYKDDLEKEIPDVDAYFGTMELPMLLKKLNADYKHELVGERVLTTSNHYAYLKISEGCDRPCSFCAIPVMRGGHRSTPMDELVLQASNMAKNGTKELLLIAQDSTYYGLDLYGKRNLAELMDKLAAVEGIDWIRLHYAYPSGFPLGVLDTMVQHDNICNYLDIPLQHASSNLLQLMRRGTTRDKTEKLLDEIRAKVSNITLRTTMIVGHPGETEQDFLELVDFVKEQRFDRLGVFTYSHEEQTHSYSMEDSIPEEEKEARVAELMEVQQEISAQKNKEKEGKVFKVLFDRAESGYFVGRTEADSPEVDNEVLVPAEGNFVRLGDFADVKITQADAFDLYGEIVSPSNT